MQYPIVGGTGGGDSGGQYYIYVHSITPRAQRYSYEYAINNHVSLQFGATCYKKIGNEYDYLPMSYELRKGGLDGELLYHSEQGITLESQDISVYNQTPGVPNSELIFNNIESQCDKNTVTTFTLILTANYQEEEENETTHEINLINKQVRRPFAVTVTLNELLLTSSFKANETLSTNDS